MSPFRAPRRAPGWVRDLELIDTVLRTHPAVTRQLVTVMAEVLAGRDSPLSAEQWLRAVFVQQTSGYDDTEMGFMLNDSKACRAFCGLVDLQIPQASIDAILRRVDEITWTRLEQTLLPYMQGAWKKRYHERIPG